MPRSHKSEQLAAQVKRALEHALSVQDQDQDLWDLEVVQVAPGHEGSHMTVIVQGHRTLADCSGKELLERVQMVRNHLVHEVAACISRRRIPELVFRVLPEGVQPIADGEG